MTETRAPRLGLKTGWQKVKFGDVVRQCKEKVDRENNAFERYVEGGHMDSEDIHIRRWGVFGEDYVGPAFHRIFRKGQILYGSRRTYLKKVAVADFDGITANTTFVLETKDPNVFMQELLPFLMLTDRFTEHSIGESKGSTNPYINYPDIAKFEFSLPPIEEQKRIAEILWAADEAVEKHLSTSEALAAKPVTLSGVKCSLQTEWLQVKLGRSPRWATVLRQVVRTTRFGTVGMCLGCPQERFMNDISQELTSSLPTLLYRRHSQATFLLALYLWQ